jgi:hypothetical protein
MSIYSGFGLRK